MGCTMSSTPFTLLSAPPFQYLFSIYAYQGKKEIANEGKLLVMQLLFTCPYIEIK